MFEKSVFTNYFIVNVVLTLVFALLYYLSDIVMSIYAEEAYKLNLGRIKKVDKFGDHLRFSTITQTTVGFVNHHYHANTSESVPFVILTYLQLISIFMVSGYFFT
jgi:hypothetical protein